MPGDDSRRVPLGASIVAAMAARRRQARGRRSFPFFLAIRPWLARLHTTSNKSRAEMTTDHLGIIAIGYRRVLITALIVVKTFLTYVTRHGFTLFAWWRVIVGTLGLIALAMGR